MISQNTTIVGKQVKLRLYNSLLLIKFRFLMNNNLWHQPDLPKDLENQSAHMMLVIEIMSSTTSKNYQTPIQARTFTVALLDWFREYLSW